MKTVVAFILPLTLLLAGEARAASVSVDQGDAAGDLIYRADPGETNAPRFAVGDITDNSFTRTVTVTDPSAALIGEDPYDPSTKQDGCVSVDAHTVTCTSSGDDRAYVYLGDGDDSVSVAGPATKWFLIAHGGDGDDHLIGSDDRAYGDSLYGGRGHDRIEGRRGDDRLRDDSSGPDTIIGGPGHDLLGFAASYESGPRPPVRFAAGKKTRAGTTAGDRVTGVESIAATSGADSLTGGGRGYELDGAGGPDRITCRSAKDVVVDPHLNDTFASCHRARITLFSDALSFDLRPKRTGHILRFNDTSCALSTCPIELALRHRGTLVARGTIVNSIQPTSTARLTRAGRRLLSRPHGVVVRARLEGPYRAVADSFRFRLHG